MSVSLAEHFYSIQGEGITIGVPSVFLRLRGCNLTCGGGTTVTDGKFHNGATWRCDTIEVWLKGKKKTNKELFELLVAEGYHEKLLAGAHLVITGGEPLLQMDELEEFIQYLDSLNGGKVFIEVETNGTVLPCLYLANRVNQWNVSPKLKNSGIEEGLRINKNAIDYFAACNNSIFKFVISNEEDLIEAQASYIHPFSIRVKSVYLMPATDTKESLDKIFVQIAELAKKYCYRLTNRMHLQLWDRKTGV